MGIYNNRPTKTDVDIAFGTYAAVGSSTYGAAGVTWASSAGSAYWRVKKVAGGQAVGFGAATATQSGLVNTTTQTFAGIKNNSSTPAFKAYRNSSWSFNSATGGGLFQIAFDTEVFDQGSVFDTGTAKFTCPTGGGGKYFFSANAAIDGGGGGISDQESYTIFLRKNSTIVCRKAHRTSVASADYGFGVCDLIDLAAGDTVDVLFATSSGDTVNGSAGDQQYTNFCGYKVS
jgi:hypothetical protein